MRRSSIHDVPPDIPAHARNLPTRFLSEEAGILNSEQKRFAGGYRLRPLPGLGLLTLS